MEKKGLNFVSKQTYDLGQKYNQKFGATFLVHVRWLSDRNGFEIAPALEKVRTLL
jgi:hypothetical protein